MGDSIANEIFADSLEAAMNLLMAWNLSQLCEKFREQEVCINAFQYITDADICELVPKIGPRSIFRARLAEWRQQQHQQVVNMDNTVHKLTNENRKRQLEVYEGNNAKKVAKDCVGVTKIKAEAPEVIANTEEPWLKDVQLLQAEHENESFLDTQDTTSSSHLVDDETDDGLETDENKDMTPNDSNGEKRTMIVYYGFQKLDLKELLINSFEGRQAIEFYKTHKTLDVNHRKKIVEIIISVVIEKRVAVSSEYFYSLTQQLIELFPTEHQDTYYVPRRGVTCPKGMLYNKYTNLSRRLRKDGLLEYRNAARLTP